MEYVQAHDGQVLYYDKDSIIYISCSGDRLITTDTTGDSGQWPSELPFGDYITEFVSAGPETYASKTASGKHASQNLRALLYII